MTNGSNPIALRLNELGLILEGGNMPEIVAVLEIAAHEINRLHDERDECRTQREAMRRERLVEVEGLREQLRVAKLEEQQRSASLGAAVKLLERGSHEPKEQRSSGWLLEHDKARPYKWVRAEKYQGFIEGTLEWTEDASLAIRFAREVDAKQFAWLHFEFGKEALITEHVFVDNSLETKEGYSQAYADQMRTALSRISGMIDSQGNAIEMHREELRGIASTALRPITTTECQS